MLRFLLLHLVTYQSLTLLPGLSDDIGGALAHHLGDVERAVGLIGHGHRAVHGLRLHLGKRCAFSVVHRSRANLRRSLIKAASSR